MKLTELESVLEDKGYKATYVEIDNKNIKQNRTYLDVDKKFNIYFVDFENKPFMYIFINQPKGFDYANYKQSDEEKQRCREAKFKVLAVLNGKGIIGLEQYESIEATSLFPKKGKKETIEL